MQTIWIRELTAYHKHLADNTFVLRVLTPILDCTIREIENLDISARKILNMTGNFHRTSVIVDYICLAEMEVED